MVYKIDHRSSVLQLCNFCASFKYRLYNFISALWVTNSGFDVELCIHVARHLLHNTRVVFLQINHFGRPKKDVTVEDILSLRQLNYSWKKICDLLHISRSTLYRRMQESGISVDDYAKLSESSLDKIIQDIKVNHPKDGERLMQGHLSRISLNVRRKDLRSAIHRVDPHGLEARKRYSIKRRAYCVPYPNALWHLDSHHKLIRWRLVIHGAIDGFSRLVLYLECANNNQAATVVSMFKKGVSYFGLPKQITANTIRSRQ